MVTTSQRLNAMLTPIHEVEGTTVRCSALPSPLAHTVALDLLNDPRCTTGWLLDGETSYLRIETAKANRLLIAFGIERRPFLKAAGERGRFTLVIEGMVPVEIPILIPPNQRR